MSHTSSIFIFKKAERKYLEFELIIYPILIPEFIRVA